MPIRQRLTALLLSAALLIPAFPAVRAADPDSGNASGSISATVRIDSPQSLEALQDRDLRMELSRDGSVLGWIPLTGDELFSLGGCSASVSLRNQDGGELGGGRWPGYLDFTVSGLPRGNYSLSFTGDGYVPYTHSLSLDQYSQHVILGTADATFTLGDVNGDGRVDSRDRDLLAAALGSGSSGDLSRYDLTGDGLIDIHDLACVTRGMSASGSAQTMDTACLAPPVDFEALEEALTQSGTAYTGRLSDLFQAGGGNDGNSPVLFSAGEDAPLRLSIPLTSAVELQELKIFTPEGPNEILSGSVGLAFDDGTYEETPFDNTAPAGVHAISAVPGSGVITIALGRRVAVKQITITVTRTADGDYAAVESIQFLRDIVPENPVAPNSQVRNLSAEPLDGTVRLRWNELPNVTGYRVDYWAKDGSGEKKSLRVDVPRAEVTGLENLKVYCFTVTPLNGAWEGLASETVTAEPQPSKAPDAPDMISTGALDSALQVSWKASKGATYYQLYYKAASDSDFRLWADRTAGTSVTLTGLTNGVTYSIYLLAGNAIGLSGKSRIAEGTPKGADYSRPEGIPQEGVLEGADIERVWLADSGNISSSSYPADKPFQTAYMNDGDFSTHWTSQSYDDGNWERSKQVFASFAQPVDLSAVLWVPRLDGGYPSNLRRYTVTVWRQGDELSGPGTMIAPDPGRGGSGSDMTTWLPVQNNPTVTRFAVLPFEPVTDVVKIAVTIDQVRYTAVSLSELMFLSYDPAHCLPDNIADLFTDELRLSLRSGVTQAEIDALRARLDSSEKNFYLNTAVLADELDLAEELLSGSSSGVVLEGVDARSTGADSGKYGQSGSALQPLGAAAKANDEITIYASGIPDGQSIPVYASQFNAEVSAWRTQAGTLTNGRNILTIPKTGSQNTASGGSLYFTYNGPDPENIRLHVRRAVDIPFLDLSDWYSMSDAGRQDAAAAYMDELDAYVSAQGISSAGRTTNCLNVTEIATPVVLLSLPAAAVLSGTGQSREERTGTLLQSVLAWEDVFHICNTTQGIDNTYVQNDMVTRQNIRCMQMFSGAFMYAAGNHIGIGYGSCAGMVCGKPIAALESGAVHNGLFGWGIAHEIGHNMDKLGKAEITNNLYSLMVQTYDGKQNTLPSRLENSGKYASVFTKTAQGWPGSSNDVFTQLGLYWQLHLAYDGGENPLDFYNRFFKAWKAGTYFNGASEYGDRLALTASAVANRDLTEFFTRWGVSLSESTRKTLEAYDPEPRAVWYLSDESRRARLAGEEAASGTVSVSAELTENKDNEITVTISPAITGELQGYEIRRSSDGGKTFQPIAFTTDTTYKDLAGSANHRTYSYQIAAYDIQGNAVNNPEDAVSGEVRIAYDKTVATDAYILSRNGDTVIFELKEEIPVSGLKLTGDGIPQAGPFTAVVTDGDGADVTACEGDFSEGNQAADDTGSYLTYFHKPGSPAGDTSIWTYDAKTVTVTGIPADVPDEDIRLISYAGDDVALLEGGFAGLLSKEYPYGGGSGDVIPAGTLVIAGTYRGNPVYQTVKIEGRFTDTVLTGGEDGEETVTQTTVTRWLDGKALLFAEVPEDGKIVSDISDGFFLFIPNIQREAELQGELSNCAPSNLLPTQIRAVLSRTDLPDSAGSQRVTAETLWVNAPGGTDLPTIVLEEGE